MAQETSAAGLKKIVILGASYGGIPFAHYTLRHTIPSLPEKESYQVVLVSTSAEAFCRPAAPRALISDEQFDQSKLFVGIEKNFDSYPKDSFKFVQGRATAWDHNQCIVTVTLPSGSTETIDYYALVIATGGSTPSPLFGFNHGDSTSVKEAWKTFREALPSAKSIVICGGGPAGVETAAEISEYFNGRAGYLSSKLANPKVSVTIVTAGDKLLPVMSAARAKKVEAQLDKVGVAVVKNTRVTAVEPANSGLEGPNFTAKTKVLLDSGKEMDADIYIPASGMTPNTEFVTDKSLLTPGGQILVDSSFKAEKAGERVYAIGDVGSAHRPAIHLMRDAVPMAAANLKRDLLLAAGKAETDAGVPKAKIFTEDKRETHIVPVGKSVSGGVGAVMGWSIPSLMVWGLKGRDYWLWSFPNIYTGAEVTKEV
jgi:apoptosis-inducing factor 2